MLRLFRIFCYFLLFLFLVSCHRTYSPVLYPSSVTKTIKYFNYCLNNISDRYVFGQLEDILLDDALVEFEEVLKIVYGVGGDDFSKRHLDFGARQKAAYISYAKSLRIEVTRVEVLGESGVGARVFALFFNKELLIEEGKVIEMEQEDEIWKIKSISPLLASSG